jgi:hypothetical protein
VLLEIVSGEKLRNAYSSEEKTLQVSKEILRPCLLLKDQEKKDFIDSYLIEIDKGQFGVISFSRKYIIIDSANIYVTTILRKWKMPVTDPEIMRVVAVDSIMLSIDSDSEYFDLIQAENHINEIIEKETNNDISFEDARNCMQEVWSKMNSVEYRLYAKNNSKIINRYKME